MILSVSRNHHPLERRELENISLKHSLDNTFRVPFDNTYSALRLAETYYNVFHSILDQSSIDSGSLPPLAFFICVLMVGNMECG